MRTKAEVMQGLARVPRRTIVIQHKVITKDQYGDVTEVWEVWRTLRAERSNLWGRDYYAALAVGEEQAIEFTVRHVSFLDELKTDTHRLLYAGEVYDIRQVDYLDDDGMWIKLRAVKQA